jgi:hypothetical protein
VYFFAEDDCVPLKGLAGAFYGPLRFFCDDTLMAPNAIERELQDLVASANKPANENQP